MDKSFRLRLAIAFLLIVCLGVAVSFRAANLMLIPSEKLQAAAERQLKQDQPPRLPRRGQILDRNGEPLAVSFDVKSLYVNPSKIENKTKLAIQLASLLKIPANQIKAKLSEKRGFVWIKRQLSESETNDVALWLQQNRTYSLSVAMADESKRFYPNQNLASNLLGFTNVDSRGIEGLEYNFDKELSGERQKSSLVEADAVVLTIDKALQHILEKELEVGVARTNAASATSIVMDAASGEILAMGSFPNYNPNQFKSASADVRRNRAVTDTYEPGSTMKPILVAGALEAQLLTPTTKFFCELGKFQVGKHWIREAEAKDKWGWLKTQEIIQKSSNIGATKIGYVMGSERLFNWYKKQGFQTRTGIDFPGEVPGVLPPYKSWAKIHLSNIAFGQGMSITPIQLAQAYASFANDGLEARPRLVREWRTYEGQVKERTPEPAPTRVMKLETAKAMQKMLSMVATTEGTAIKAAVPGFIIAGKTGTAQKAYPGHGYRSGKYIASFVGFALNVEPKYVVMVMVDEPKFPYFGGEAAAPIFQKIMTAALARAGVAPDPKLLPVSTPMMEIPYSQKTPSLTAPPVLASPKIGLPSKGEGWAMPDLIGASAKEVLEAFSRQPVALRLKGSGSVIDQYPLPGAVLKRGETVSIRLQSDEDSL